MITVQFEGLRWFLGVAAGLETGAAIIALLVALASAKVYRITHEKKYFSFGASFFLIGLSFLSRAITDKIIQGSIFKVADELLSKVFLIGYLAHIGFALVAYSILLIVTYKIKDRRLWLLLFALLVPSMLLSASYFASFYLLSFILLAFITLAFFNNYRAVCTQTSCIVFISFLLLTLAQAQFLAERTHSLLFLTAHVTQALGFVLMLIALLKALSK